MPGGRTTDVEYTGKSSKTGSMKRWSVIKSKKVCDKKSSVTIQMFITRVVYTCCLRYIFVLYCIFILLNVLLLNVCIM